MKASVCMASFNRDPEILRRVLQSIFTQRPPFEFEVVVADDGSKCGAPEVCKEFDVQYVRIEREPVVRCPAAARNAAYKRARGEIIIAQSDDVVHETPQAMERLCAILEENPNTFVIANVIAIDKQGKLIRAYTSPGVRGRRPFFFLGALWRKDLYAIGGDDEDFTRSGGYCYEDKWFAKCLLDGFGLKPLFLEGKQVKGVHQYHEDRFRTDPSTQYDVARKEINWRIYRSKKHRAQLTGAWCASGGPWEMNNGES